MSDSPAAELIVVRHGETVWNADGRQQGHLDSPLSPLGERQARAIAERLADEELDALYSSDLGRAYHTAEHIAAKIGHPIVTDQRLRERNLGIFQTLTVKQVEERYPDEYARFNGGDIDYAIPEGESVRQRNDRIVAAAEDIAAGHPDQRVVIVAHGGVLRSLFHLALGIPLSESRRYKLFNASLNSFFARDGKWTLGTWGDVSHLHGMGTMDDW